MKLNAVYLSPFSCYLLFRSKEHFPQHPFRKYFNLHSLTATRY